LTNIQRLARAARSISRKWSHYSGVQRKPDLPEPRPLRLGVALGGGFARGLAHIGVLKTLEEAGIPVDFVAGTSAGAIVGACYCAGMSAAEVAEVARTARFRDFARWTLSRYGFCSNDRMTAFCDHVVKASTFEELKVPLAIIATDFRTGGATVFTKGTLSGPLRASCAYPGMFLPVEIDGRYYIDGMLAYGVPTTPLRQIGADRVLGVFLSSHWSQQRAPRHLFEVIGQCFSIAQARMSELWKKDADLVLEPDVQGFGYDCFDRAQELIALGAESMRAVLPELKMLLNPTFATNPLPGDIASVPAPVPPAVAPSTLAV